jgi:hypothetical protein
VVVSLLINRTGFHPLRDFILDIDDPASGLLREATTLRKVALEFSSRNLGEAPRGEILDLFFLRNFIGTLLSGASRRLG